MDAESLATRLESAAQSELLLLFSDFEEYLYWWLVDAFENADPSEDLNECVMWMYTDLPDETRVDALVEFVTSDLCLYEIVDRYFSTGRFT